ncbi:MAG: LamG-like jellyroll fold domain-containing protein [Candidatus Paceibacterota bacterium]
MNKLLKQAFTLIELLVVIAIIGILSGIIAISMQDLLKKATAAKSQAFSNSLRNFLSGNIVSEWKFDGITSGGSPATLGDVLDTWGDKNNGSVPFPPTIETGSDCISGSCLRFDGENDYVDFGTDSSLSMGMNDYTLSFWVNFDNAVASQYETLFICGADAAGRDGYWVRRSSQTRLQLDFSDGTSSPLTGFLSPTNSLVNDIWYYIVIVFDRDSVAQAYIDGIKQSNSLDISSQQGDVQNFSNLRVGAFSSALHRFDGRMDEIRIYNTAATILQIKQKYYLGLNNFFMSGVIDSAEYYSRIKAFSSLDF